MSSIPPSVHVISNKVWRMGWNFEERINSSIQMEFSDEGICTGFRLPLIHTFNKNSSVISKGEAFFDKITHRTSNNVLLIGDSLGGNCCWKILPKTLDNNRTVIQTRIWMSA